MDQTAKAIACVIGGMILITLQDATVKWLSNDYPLYEIVFARATVAIFLILAVMHFEGGFGLVKTDRLALCIGRGLLMVIANTFFFMAVVAMPLAEAMAILFVSPLLVTVVSIPILGEKVGARRWAAVIVGLLGVVVMLRPSTEAMRLAAFFPLIAACAYTALIMMTRKLGATERASTMSFYLQASFIVASVAAGLSFGDGRLAATDDLSLFFVFRAWSWPSLDAGVLMVACGLLIGSGNLLMTQAYRIGEATMVAPFEYTALPMAVLWGYLLWGHFPDWIAFIGIALIAGSGLFIFYRETKTGRLNATEKPVPRSR